MQGKAVRRHHRDRIKRRAIQKWMQWGGKPTDDKAIGRLIQTPAPCSCPGCRNQRSNGWLNSECKLTMQERRHLLDEVFGLQELDEECQTNK